MCDRVLNTFDAEVFFFSDFSYFKTAHLDAKQGAR